MEKIDLIIEIIKANQLETEGRFNRIDEKFETIDKRFDQLDRRFDRLENRVDRMEGKLDAVYEHRDQVTIKFGWQWSLISLTLVFLGVSASRALPF